jgi:hypothetical protein
MLQFSRVLTCADAEEDIQHKTASIPVVMVILTGIWF